MDGHLAQAGEWGECRRITEKSGHVRLEKVIRGKGTPERVGVIGSSWSGCFTVAAVSDETSIRDAGIAIEQTCYVKEEC
jgi:hypothetical protein